MSQKYQPMFCENNTSLVNANDTSYVSFHITDSDGDNVINMTQQETDYSTPDAQTRGFLLLIVAPGTLVVQLNGSDDDHTFTIQSSWMTAGQILNFRVKTVMKTGTTATFKAVW